MDELALLKEFRLEDASPDGAREHARAALERAMTRRRLPRRRYTVVLAFALAAVLAAASYAIVHQFVIGSAAPKDVQDEIGLRLAVIGGSNLLAPGSPYKLAEPARIAAGTQSPAGPVYMLLGRIKGGGECQFVWYSGERTPGGLPITSGACGLGKQRHARGFGYAYEFDGSLAGTSVHAHRGIRTRRRSHANRQPLLQDAVRLVHRRVPRPRAPDGVRRARRNRGASPAEVIGREAASSAPARPVVPVVPTKPRMSSSRRAPAGSRRDIHVTPHGQDVQVDPHARAGAGLGCAQQQGRSVHLRSSSTREQTATDARLRVAAAATERARGNPLPVGWVAKQNAAPGVGARARPCSVKPV